MKPRTQMSPWLLCILTIGIAGCLGESPTEFRDINQLVVGHWEYRDAPEIPNTVDFRPDGTCAASSGMPELLVPDFHGSFWQRGDVIGVRGSGAIEGVRVAFVRVAIVTEPSVELTITGIRSEYVSELVGVEDLDALGPDGVRDVVRQLVGFDLPREALGVQEIYVH